jgi:hypothetical protein
MSDRFRRWWARFLPVAVAMAAFALAVGPDMRRW